MPFRDILVFLDEFPHSAQRLAVAADIAGRHGAQLIGLRVERHPIIPNMIRAGIPQAALDAQQLAIRSDSERIEADFRAVTRDKTVKATFRLVPQGDIDDVCRQARYANVTVVSQGDPHADEEFSGNTVIHDLLLSAGRPLIVIPNGFVAGPVGHHITVAWNGSREASRAVADAMPMLQMAEKVSVLVARSDDAQEVIRLVLDHLNRNLVAASARVLDAGDHDAGAAILAEADADGSDLIVMGGYGRARLREFVLGGATRQIVHHAPIPILVSH